MVAVLALAGVACGGDDDGDAPDGASATSDNATATSDDSNGEDSGDDAGSGGGEWCDLARDLESNTVFDDIDVDDPDSVENAYRESIDILDNAVDSAPDEIKADVETVLASTEKLVDALEDVDFDFAALDESVLGDLETVDASDRIEEYGVRVCGISSDENSEDTLVVEGDVDDIDEGAIRDRLVTMFEALGITEDQADCLVDNMDSEDLAASGDQVDPSMFLHLYETCGIDFDSQPGG
jgi:hypothetical protein